MKSIVIILLVSFIVVHSIAAQQQDNSLPITSLSQLQKLADSTEYLVVVTASSQITASNLVKEVSSTKQILKHDKPNLNIKYIQIHLDKESSTMMGDMSEQLKNKPPTLILYREGKARMYQGQPNSLFISNWLLHITNTPAVVEIDNKNKKKYLNAGEENFPGTNQVGSASGPGGSTAVFYFPNVRVIGYFSSKSDPLYKTFESLAKYYQTDIAFAVVLDEKLAKNFKLKNVNSVAILKPQEKPLINSDSNVLSSYDSFYEWIEENKEPTWQELSLYNMLGSYTTGKQLAKFVYFYDKSKQNENTKAFTVFKTLAKEYSSKEAINFVLMDSVIFRHLITNMDLNVDSDLPAFVIMKQGVEYIYPKQDNKNLLELKPVKQWLENYLQSKLAPRKKADLYDYDTSSVEKVTSLNFDQVVLNNQKNVLVEFYAPWCSHCKSLVPVYQKLASKYNNDDEPESNIVIASMESSQDSPPVEIKGFPTILFFGKDNKNKPIEYNGARDFDSLDAFVRENSGLEVVYPAAAAEPYHNEETN